MTYTTNINANLAISAQSLDSLRAKAKQSPDQALKAAAQQFEAVFMNLMMKSMRDATPQDGLFDSEQSKMYTGMLDQQLAQNMAGKGIGLAEIMIRQLGGAANAAAANERTTNAGKGIGLAETMIRQPGGAPNAVTAYEKITSQGAVNDQSAKDQTQHIQTPRDFVQHFAGVAAQVSNETGVPVHLMLGQAALESGWGRREIRTADGNTSHNLFGIKATGDWNGKVAEVVTTEYRDGVATKQVAKFRAYDSYAEAFSDYARLLRDNPRYAPVMAQGQNPAAAAQALQRAGYATDPNYADKLAGVMNRISTYL